MCDIPTVICRQIWHGKVRHTGYWKIIVLVSVHKREVESLLHTQVLVNLISRINRERDKAIAEAVTVVTLAVCKYCCRIGDSDIIIDILIRR